MELSTKKKRSMEPDWANLDALALSLILDNLKESVDHMRFEAVCKSWQSVAKTQQPFKSNAPPMLMFDAKRGTSFYHIPGARIHYFPSIQFTIPDHFVGCVGFHHGWFASTLDSSSSPITLRNPFKNNVAPIVFRPLNYEILSRCKKVILSSDPIASANDYVVAAIENQNRIYFIRPGQKRWTQIRDEGCFFTNIAFYKGLIYAVVEDQPNDEFSIVSFDPSSIKDETTIPNMVLQGRHDDDHDNDIYKNKYRKTINHLVESLEGELWVVRQFGDDFDQFHVYKVEQNGKLVRLKSLGDNVLFVDRLGSVSVSFSDFSNCLHKDSIYYFSPTPFLSRFTMPANFTTYDIKKDEQARRYYCCTLDPSINLPGRFWIQPPF